MTLVYLHKPMS